MRNRANVVLHTVRIHTQCTEQKAHDLKWPHTGGMTQSTLKNMCWWQTGKSAKGCLSGPCWPVPT